MAVASDGGEIWSLFYEYAAPRGRRASVVACPAFFRYPLHPAHALGVSQNGLHSHASLTPGALFGFIQCWQWRRRLLIVLASIRPWPRSHLQFNGLIHIHNFLGLFQLYSSAVLPSRKFWGRS
jgi:hypothetical protein